MSKYIMKIKLKIHSFFVECLYGLLCEQGEVLDEMFIEPYGTTRYEILKLHLTILDLKVNVIKEVLKMK